MIHRVFVLLGSNYQAEENLETALTVLRRQCRIKGVSPVYQSPPADGAVTNDYLNMAVVVETDLPPENFKIEVLQAIEILLGRKRGPESRVTIDLDIMFWDEAVLDYGARPWHVPHPDAAQYGHAVRPLADLAPDYVHPEDGRTLAEIAADLPTDGLHPRTDLQLN